ncbi:GNAT family N-acetyltransferase [Rubrivivax sp. RP6-9]|uniref:GNAT family N-acetyltransferase n=1 Tax=Rubrivivax sp. RP6-9 TaxID=3415750 RepID=UPI003CC5689D
MHFALLPLSTAALEKLAESHVPAELAERAEPESMPPPFVAARALKMEAQPEHQALSTSYLIVREKDSRFVGACGFKTPIGANRVEIGYGVASAARGQGAATAALKLLIGIAAQSGSTEVLAEVLPDNAASIRVIQKAGFVQVGARVDEDSECVIQWLYRCGA